MEGKKLWHIAALGAVFMIGMRFSVIVNSMIGKSGIVGNGGKKA